MNIQQQKLKEVETKLGEMLDTTIFEKATTLEDLGYKTHEDFI